MAEHRVNANLIVTSPPYFNCRDYTVGVKNSLGSDMTTSPTATAQLGHEKTPFEYVRRLAQTFDQPEKILAPDGSLFIVIGDTFAKRQYVDALGVYPTVGERETIGINHLLVMEMRRRGGWMLWQEIVWAKPSVPPSGAAQQRCNPCHEYILWFCRQPKPKFDRTAVREEGKTAAGKVMPPVGGKKYGDYKKVIVSDGKKCRQDVWTMCPSRDTVADPFAGTRTTERVALALGRNSIAFDIIDYSGI